MEREINHFAKFVTNIIKLYKGVASRIATFPVQTPLGARPGFETQPRYEAPGNFRVEIEEHTAINIGLVTMFPREWPKTFRGTTK